MKNHSPTSAALNLNGVSLTWCPQRVTILSHGLHNLDDLGLPPYHIINSTISYPSIYLSIYTYIYICISGTLETQIHPCFDQVTAPEHQRDPSLEGQRPPKGMGLGPWDVFLFSEIASLANLRWKR